LHPGEGDLPENSRSKLYKWVRQYGGQPEGGFSGKGGQNQPE